MRVTKFVHSCLLVEEGHHYILIDPGRYSWDSHMLNPNHLPQLTHMVFTHEHGDHYDEEALRALSQLFPHAQIVTNNDLGDKINDLNLPNPITGTSDDDITVFEAEHEPLPMKLPVPLNIGVHIANKLTHPGDSLDFSRSCDVLALAVSAPGWTHLKPALDKAIKLKPKKILPVHDWHWHEQARKEQYSRIKKWLEPKSIEFIELKNAEPVEI